MSAGINGRFVRHFLEAVTVQNVLSVVILHHLKPGLFPVFCRHLKPDDLPTGYVFNQFKTGLVPYLYARCQQPEIY